MSDNKASVPPLPFFAPSAKKLVILSLLSLGLYPAYWLYKNWQQMKITGHKNVLPWARVLIYPLIAHGCFKWIEDAAKKENLKPQWTAGLLAIGFLIITGAWLTEFPLAYVSLLNFFPVLKSNELAIAVNKKQGGPSAGDEKITGTDIFVAVFGAIYFASTFLLERLTAQLTNDMANMGLNSPF